MVEEKKDTKKDTITIKKDDLWKYSTFILAAIIIVGALIVFTGDNTPSGNTNNDPGQQLPSTGSQAQTSEDDDAVLGDEDAPVTIIEFSDYQCPYCARFWSDTLPSLKKEYIDTGKVKLIYRDYPLVSIHPMAQPAAEAAECVRDAAGSDEAYFEMHDKIFANQQTLSVDNLKKWAKEIGYDIGGCLDSGKFTNEVKKDTTDGGSLGTPTFFVNGKQLRGAQPFSAFKQVIDAELA